MLKKPLRSLEAWGRPTASVFPIDLNREAAKYYLGELILYYNTNNISRVPFNIYKGGINLVVRQQQGRGGGGGGKDEKK